MATIWPLAAEPRGDHDELFKQLADRLVAAVRAAVRTSPVNVEDACAFAWLQLVRYRPERACAFGWLRKTAIREAVRLERRSVRTVAGDPEREHSRLARARTGDPAREPARRRRRRSCRARPSARPGSARRRPSAAARSHS